MRIKDHVRAAMRAARVMAFLLHGVALPLLGGCLYKSACEAYSDDVYAKLESCGVTFPPRDVPLPAKLPLPTSGECTNEIAERVDCFDTCLPQLDCACTRDPTGEGCADRMEPYNDCIDDCGTPKK